MEINLKNSTLVFFIFHLILIIIDKINSVQISTNCPNNQYYDPNLFDCLICPTNMVPRKDGNKI